MERFKIEDFTTSNQLGIDRLVLECLKPHLDSRKQRFTDPAYDHSRLEVSVVQKLLKEKIFVSSHIFLILKPKLGIQQENVSDEDLKWALLTVADPMTQNYADIKT